MARAPRGLGDRQLADAQGARGARQGRDDDCAARLSQATGRPREEAEDVLQELFDNAEKYKTGGESPREALGKAAWEKLQELGEAAAIRRRNAHMDAMKAVARQRWYTQMINKGIDPFTVLEAKLVGVNTPFTGSRLSLATVAGQLAEKWINGFSLDLETAGLGKIFASRAIEKEWARELFQINLGRMGKPGITKNENALKIAQLIHKQQKDSVATINRDGGYVRSYSGYITKTSHDADLIRTAATPGRGKGGTDADRAAWSDAVMPLLDLRRTFGSDDPVNAKAMLDRIWVDLKNGEHFDISLLDEPRVGNVARQASASRELHFRDADSWLAYNARFGRANPTRTVMQAFDQAARRTALLREFGTKPREEFRADIANLKAMYKETPHFQRIKDVEQKLWNRYNQIDGSENKPANRVASNIINGWMSIQRASKLMRAPFTHLAGLPAKASALRYIGVPFAERWKTMFSDMLRGSPGTEKRIVGDLLLEGIESTMDHVWAKFDNQDSVHGWLAEKENKLFRYTGITALTENQRVGAERIAARHVGMNRGKAWEDLHPKDQRMFDLYGMGKPEWDAINKVDWHTFSDRTYLTPDIARRLSDDQVAAMLGERRTISQRALGSLQPQDIVKAREDLVDAIHAMYYDQGREAIFEPSARTRAMLYQSTLQSSPPLALALRLLYQFRVWPAEMIMRTWGRTIYGGDSTKEKIGGILELMAGSVIFGTVAEALREFIQGQDPTTRIAEHPVKYITRGFLRSGAGTIAGDYLLGEYDRHGLSILASMAGPTYGQIEPLNNLRNDLQDAVLKGKWGRLGAESIRFLRTNMPAADMWWTFKMFDYLVTNELQEWLNPGYLRRMEQRMKQKQGTTFWLSPQKVHQTLHGN
jgi:hypothetical protein